MPLVMGRIGRMTQNKRRDSFDDHISSDRTPEAVFVDNRSPGA
jgi:hypothetical protein